MDIRSQKTRKSDKLRAGAYLNDVEKNQLAIRAVVAKRKGKVRLDASQNALRIVEQAIGGKLVEKRAKRFKAR